VDPQAGQVREERGSMRSLLLSCAVLALVIALSTAILAVWGWSRSGTPGLFAALVAGAVCGLSGNLALVITFLGQRTGNPIAGLLGGMLFRLGLPLATGLAVNSLGGPLAAAGCFGMIVAVYLVALPVETALSLRFIPKSKVSPQPTSSSPSSAASAGASG